MTSLNTKNICFLAAFLFLSIDPTLAEVVTSVANCNQFLRQQTPPTIPGVLVNGAISNNNRYKVICQTFNGAQQYLTVYDTVNKIPVFSAYQYIVSLRGRPDVTWMAEPQLVNMQNGPNMKSGLRRSNNNPQAVNSDYDTNNPGYDKGHLFPVRHAQLPDTKISTFTLTNAVPQVAGFNRGRWNTMEHCMKCVMDNYINRQQMNCFVVVGAIPDNNPNNNLNGVNIPTMMWSAFHCSNQGQNVQSGTYWSNNNDVDTLHEGTLQHLQNTLGIVAFP